MMTFSLTGLRPWTRMPAQIPQQAYKNAEMAMRTSPVLHSLPDFMFTKAYQSASPISCDSLPWGRVKWGGVMPNGFTERQTEELDRAAEEFMTEHTEVGAKPLPSIVMREVTGETVFLYEKVDAYISKLQPTTKEERRKNGDQYRALSEAWNGLKKQALKRAKSPAESS